MAGVEGVGGSEGGGKERGPGVGGREGLFPCNISVPRFSLPPSPSFFSGLLPYPAWQTLFNHG